MKNIIVFMILLVPITVYAEDLLYYDKNLNPIYGDSIDGHYAYIPDKNRWTDKDTAFQLGFTALAVIDWAQTINATRMQKDSGIIETNRIMGSSPHPDKVHLYMASAIVTHAAISYLLDEEYRRIWQSTGIGVELASVGRNWSMGIQARF